MNFPEDPRLPIVGATTDQSFFSRLIQRLNEWMREIAIHINQPTTYASASVSGSGTLTPVNDPQGLIASNIVTLTDGVYTVLASMSASVDVRLNGTTIAAGQTVATVVPAFEGDQLTIVGAATGSLSVVRNGAR